MRRASPTALLYLRGRDADARLRELVGRRARVRPVLAELAVVLLKGRAYEPLGCRSLGDWSRERIGVGSRTVREWARVGRALAELPRLRAAVLAGEVPWTVARKIVAHVTPEDEEACLETVRGRTVRAVEALLRAAWPGDRSAPSDEERVTVRLPCSAAFSTKWVAALELARRVAGENLPTWECAEAISAECASRVGTVESGQPAAREHRGLRRAPEAGNEPGLRARAWPHLRWPNAGAEGKDLPGHLTRGIERCSPRQLDRRFRRAIAFLQAVDLELGRVLKQVVDRRLYRGLGFESFERYVTERLDLSARTARRLVRLARAEHTAPAVAIAFREGCTARRNLQSHHIRFRSAGGPDVACNRTTLCAYHHERGVHDGTIAMRGRAPDELTYELGIGRFRSGGVRAIPPGEGLTPHLGGAYDR